MNDFGNPSRVDNREDILIQALPTDIRALRDYLLTVRQLLDERVRDIGDSYDREVASQPELSALTHLEEAISRRVAELPCESIPEILGKFSVYDMLDEMDEGADTSMERDRLIRSIRRDIEHLTARA
ncbi:hypothetical protein [Amaricoccus macauensis]|uniref:hypothetical protein n=1 Tax=Amaricoccus macauensis TaxID=57001 RepID=UPI003C7D8CCD